MPQKTTNKKRNKKKTRAALRAGLKLSRKFANVRPRVCSKAAVAHRIARILNSLCVRRTRPHATLCGRS